MTQTRIASKIQEIREQLAINVAIAERNHPEGPIIDGKRTKGVCHSQAILASHITDRLNELEGLIAESLRSPKDGAAS